MTSTHPHPGYKCGVKAGDTRGTKESLCIGPPTTTATTTAHSGASFVPTGQKDGRCRGRELFKLTLPLTQCAAKCAETPYCRYFGSGSPGHNNVGKDGCRGWDACRGSLPPQLTGYYNRIYRMISPNKLTTQSTSPGTTTTTTTKCKWMVVWLQWDGHRVDYAKGRVFGSKASAKSAYLSAKSKDNYAMRLYAPDGRVVQQTVGSYGQIIDLSDWYPLQKWRDDNAIKAGCTEGIAPPPAPAQDNRGSSSGPGVIINAVAIVVILVIIVVVVFLVIRRKRRRQHQNMTTPTEAAAVDDTVVVATETTTVAATEAMPLAKAIEIGTFV